ncbi:MAG: bifunctional 2',3'-cyclic-nucleotide 2'-phosphodiesterase/3'-nucleotidase [Paracoccaceae bacterium]|nr:bifunctional 2',3'-cyclic-nucleotide 2'-phosphodiesterase/3'-nucleotidase [Paracoccaceae bacterium]
MALRVLGTSDVHANLLGHDYYTDTPSPKVGLARTATLIAEARDEVENSLLLDNGDFLQGTPLADYMAFEHKLSEDELHPVIAAMNHLRYDAATIGNHEFNYGLPFLTRAVAGAEFPIVLANAVRRIGDNPALDTPLFPPCAVLDRAVTDQTGAMHTLRIGILGLTPPQILTWDHALLSGAVEVRDIVETAEAYVTLLRDKTDLIIALCHSGIEVTAPYKGMEHAVVPLAALDGIDAVIAGHAHMTFPSPSYVGHAALDLDLGAVHGTPTVMPGLFGSHLGVIDLDLELRPDGWVVNGGTGRLRPIAPASDGHQETPNDPGLVTVTQQAHEATLAHIRRPIGRTEAPISSYFARVAPSACVKTINTAQRWFVARQMENTIHEGLPILSAAAPFKAGGRAGPAHFTDVPKGELALRHLADIYAYPNSIAAVLISGAQVRGWLERSMGQFHQINPGAVDAPLLVDGFASYNFDILDGVQFEIDLSVPAMFDVQGVRLNDGPGRVRNLRYEDAPIDPEAMFIVATNNYRGGGAGHFPGADGKTILFKSLTTNRDVLQSYVKAQGAIAPKPGRDWSFLPMPGTSVTFRTGPGARAHLGDVDLDLQEIGEDADGFLLYRLSL